MGCGASSQANVGPVSRNSSAGSPLREKYQAFDVDGDGEVSKCDMHAKIFQDHEFQELLVDAGRLKAADDTEEALRIVDDVRNSKGTFDFDSFKKLTQKTSNKKLFEEIDVNGDGLISKAEVCAHRTCGACHPFSAAVSSIRALAMPRSSQTRSVVTMMCKSDCMPTAQMDISTCLSSST
mmetsp:Transcript_20459/g.30497  ORF Transcript_20459/g.30497 Transcript_20459/m.30497 type:complete len:180 (+) Transcript_20459:48-587(+)